MVFDSVILWVLLVCVCFLCFSSFLNFFCCICLAICFMKRKRKRIDIELGGWGSGKDLGEFEREEPAMRIYCMNNIIYLRRNICKMCLCFKTICPYP